MNDVMQKVFGVAHRRLAYSPGDKVRRIAAFALDLRVLDFLFTTFELKRLPSGSKSLFFFSECSDRDIAPEGRQP